MSSAPLISQRIRNFWSHVNFFGINQRGQKAVRKCEPASWGNASLTAWLVPSECRQLPWDAGVWGPPQRQPHGTLRTLAGLQQADRALSGARDAG